MTSATGRWAPVIVWIAVIYTTIPFVRLLREWFVARWEPRFIGWAVAAVLVAAALLALAWLRRRSVKLPPGALLWLATVTAVLVLWTYSLRRSPEEAVHLLEYGLLAVLLHRALRPVVPDGSVFIVGGLIGVLTGTIDEVIQWLSPDRYWDWRDLVLNAGAGALIQLALWRIAPAPESRISSRSLRITLRLSVAVLVLLTLCLTNTPRVVTRYAPLLPGADHLMTSLNPMAEYGHLHRIPNVGVFKSRLELSELAAEDRTRAAEVAEAVDSTRQTFGNFLNTWPVAEDPFTYELRVHLFARNRNLALARELGIETRRAREPLTIAYFENLLVERLFPTTLENSTYGWKKGMRRRVEAAHDPDFEFRSAVGSHLITIASEGAIRTLLLAIAAGLVLADFALSRYHR